MFRRLTSTALIALQILTPAYAVSAADNQFYYRYSKTGVINPTDAVDPGDPGTGIIPEQSLQAIQANAANKFVTSASPIPALQSINAQLAGGVESVVFDGASPEVPGMSFNRATGQLTGVPSAPFTGNVVISYHDGENNPGKLNLPVAIYPYPTLVSQDSYDLKRATEAGPFNIKVSPGNDGFYAGVDYALAPNSDVIPEGLTLVNGALSGSTTAQVGSTYRVVVRATSKADANIFVDRSFTLNVVNDISIALNLSKQPVVWQFDETTNNVVSQGLFDPAPLPTGTYASPLIWSITSGPSWLGIDSIGQFTGTPAARGSYPVTVQVKDATGHTASDIASLQVIKPGYIYLSPGAQFLEVRNNETFATAVQTVSNYVGSYTFNPSGKPDDITFDTTTGVSTGTFTQDRQEIWHLYVKDDEGRTDAGGSESGTNYVQVVTSHPPVTLAAATSVNGGYETTSNSLLVQWPEAQNLLGKATYTVTGQVPGTLYYKVYDNNNPSSLATYVSEGGGSVRQGAGESAAQTEARLAPDHIVFDGLARTLSGTPSKVGAYNIGLAVADDHATTGYTVNPNEPGRLADNSASSPQSSVVVRGTGYFAVNVGGADQQLSQLTSSPTLGTALRDGLSNEAYKQSAVWTLSSGTIPPGIHATINTDTDVLTYTGSPTEQGVWDNIVWSVTDAQGQTIKTPAVSFTVGPRLELALTSTPGDSVDLVATKEAATLSVAVSGMTVGEVIPANKWTVTGIPGGVTYSVSNNNLTFAGIPTTMGTYTVDVGVTDSNGATVSKDLTFNVSVPFISYNNGGSDITLARDTSQATNNTIIRDRLSNETYTAPMTWELVSGSLPSGVTSSFSANNIVKFYSGYPTTIGTWNDIVWKVSDTNGNYLVTKPINYIITERGSLLLTPTPSNVFSAVVGAPVSMQVKASNTPQGSDVATWTVSGDLPAGVTYTKSGNTLTFSGTANASGTFAPVVAATDSQGYSASSTLTFNIKGRASLTLSGPETFAFHKYLTDGFDLVQTGAESGATFSSVSVLPTGMTLDKVNGRVTFTTPQVLIDPVALTFRVKDGLNVTKDFVVTISVGPRLAPEVNDPGILHAITNKTFLKEIGAKYRVGGNQGFAVVGGSLPKGINLLANGLLIGTPTEIGTFNFTVRETDNLNGEIMVSADRVLTIIVDQDGSPMTLSANSGTLRADQNGFIAAPIYTNAYGDLSFTAPALAGTGLSIDPSTGIISGIPSQVGTITAAVTLTDSTGSDRATTKTVTITVVPQLSLSVSPDNSLIYNHTVADAGLSQPVVANLQSAAIWTVNHADNLPTGVTFNTTTGKFVGTPTVIGVYGPVSVSVGDNLPGTANSSDMWFSVFMNEDPITLTVPAVSGKVGVQFTSAAPTFTNALNGVRFYTTETATNVTVNQTTGAITGSYPTEGAKSFKVSITDETNRVTEQAVPINLAPRMILSAPASISVDTFTAMTPVAVTRTNVIGTATWDAVSTSLLPPGITFNTSSGRFEGTPTAGGTYGPIKVTSRDSSGDVGTSNDIAFVVNLTTKFAFTDEAVKPITSPQKRVAYTFDLKDLIADNITGIAKTDLTFSINWDDPTGLPYVATDLKLVGAVLQGTLRNSGTALVTVTAANGSQSVSKQYTLKAVLPTISLVLNTNETVLGFVQQGSAYPSKNLGDLLTPTNIGKADVRWVASAPGTVNSGETAGLPSGFAVNATTGILTGTSNTVGTYRFNLKATFDNANNAPEHAEVTQQYVISIVLKPTATDGTVSAGVNHSCTVTSAGGVKCWGNNGAGQLGTGNNTASSVPVDVINLAGAVDSLTTGDSYTCALLVSGGVQCWGTNSVGQLGDGTNTNRNQPVFVSGLSSGASAVSAGYGTTCAVTQAGAAKCWGNNANGQLGDGTATSSSVPVQALASGAISITTGVAHTCVVTSNGGAKCWGLNQFGALGTGNTTASSTPVDVVNLPTTIKDIQGGYRHTCAITTTNLIYCWGFNDVGQLGNNTTTNSVTPVLVSGITSVAQMALSEGHACAVTTAGKAMCWGFNPSGAIGDNTIVSKKVATQVSGLTTGVESVGAGYRHSCASMTNGSLKCWGLGASGQLGNGAGSDTKVPVNVTGS
jgi:alpha-tubulin suppressor-like RCC1 family protein